MVLQLPINLGQKHHVASFLAGFATCDIPLDNLTASMTAWNLQHRWNQKEYFSVMHYGRSMGGTMTFGVAEVIVKGITHGQVHGRMVSLAMAVVSPTTIISSMKNNDIPPTKKTQLIYGIHEVTGEMFKEFSSSTMYEHLKACGWSVRPISALARRQEMLKAIKQSK
jgi:hypothetical protein